METMKATLIWKVSDRRELIVAGIPVCYTAETKHNRYVIQLMVLGTWNFNNCTSTTNEMEEDGFKVEGFRTIDEAKNVAQKFENKQLQKWKQ